MVPEMEPCMVKMCLLVFCVCSDVSLNQV